MIFPLYITSDITIIPVNILNSIMRLVFDTGVIVLTLYHTLGTMKLQRRLSMRSHSLTGLIIKNGLCTVFSLSHGKSSEVEGNTRRLALLRVRPFPTPRACHLSYLMLTWIQSSIHPRASKHARLFCE
jgi:hypothetical protein